MINLTLFSTIALIIIALTTTINALPSPPSSSSSGIQRQSSMLEGVKPPPRSQSPLRNIWIGMSGRQRAVTAISGGLLSAAAAVGVAGAGVAIDNSIKQRKGDSGSDSSSSRDKFYPLESGAIAIAPLNHQQQVQSGAIAIAPLNHQQQQQQVGISQMTPPITTTSDFSSLNLPL